MTRSCAIRVIRLYDQLLHKSLTKLFSRFTDEQLKEFLCAPEHAYRDAFVKRILNKAPVFSPQFASMGISEFPLLWIAVLSWYLDSAELLVLSGADVNHTCTFENSDPQKMDEKATILQTLTVMVSAQITDRSPSSEIERLERLIQVVIDHGADLQARTQEGQNVLHLAVKEGCVKLAKMFLKGGVDVNVADCDGMTPLLLAAANKKVDDLLPLLIKHGANLNAKDRSGQNALHLLSRAPGEHVDLARVLIEKGVSIHDVTTDHQYQPIHLAAQKGKNKLVSKRTAYRFHFELEFNFHGKITRGGF